MEDGYLYPLTSIVPSTTSAALTTLWTGANAAQHGIMGYEMWLKEFGLVANMILHKPMSYRGDVGGLSRAGFQPEGFITQTTLGTQLMRDGVLTHAFQHYSIARSGLSRMLIRDTDIHTFSTPADLWISVRQLLESLHDERTYIWIYWGAVDGLSHHNGPDDERAMAEFASFSAVFERNFLMKLPSETRKDTLLILTADHGQIATPRDDHLDLCNHPDLMDRLHIQPTGENRLTYLHVRPGMLEDVVNYIDKTWPNRFHVLKSDEILKTGLFGLNGNHPELSDRMGDLIVIARDDSYLWWNSEENPLLGRHGGLSPDEMLVPFLAVRL
jgi:predicted AlkP superfamily pyrophosphatase or phosphodiesterase